LATVDRAVLKNAMPLDWSRGSEAREVQTAVLAIDSAIRHLAYDRSPRDLRLFRGHIEVVVLNLFLAYFHDPNRWVFYPRNRGHIDGCTGLSAEVFLRVIEGLRRASLVEDIRGEAGCGLYDPESQRPLRSRMRGTPELFSLLIKYGVRMRMIRSQRDFPLVRLRDQDKKPIQLPNDRGSRARIKVMEANLARINAVLESSFIGLHVTDKQLRTINTRLTEDKDKIALDFSKKKLYRVFNNGSLKRGGRFTGGWWAEVPREYRPYIYIGGPRSYEPKYSAEVDFSSMFPAIAYGLLGMELDDTAYKFGGQDPAPAVRKVVKRTLLTMLMNDNRDSVRKAVHKSLSDDHIAKFPKRYPDLQQAKRRGRTVQVPINECAPKGCPPLLEIIAAMERQHDALRRDFLYNPDNGLYLMYRESQIAERVMLDMAAKGAPVLPVHDSFIAGTSWVGYDNSDFNEKGSGMPLDMAMRRAFKAELGVNCRITFDPREHQTPGRRNARPQWTAEASSVEDLLRNGYPYTTDEERKKYQTYTRQLRDWYGDKHKTQEQRSTGATAMS
jgi:hypothetical protein